MVISIACSTRLEVFQCPERENIKKKEEKKEQESHQIWIFQSIALWKANNFLKGAPPLTLPLGNL